VVFPVFRLVLNSAVGQGCTPRVRTPQGERWCRHHLLRQALGRAGLSVYNLAMSGSDTQAQVRSRAGLYQVVVSLYLAGLLLWLVIGVLPPVADVVPPLRHFLLNVAVGGGPLAGYAARLSEGALASPQVGVVALAYTFSALNLALGVLLMVKRPHDLVPRLLALAFLGTAATFNEPSHEFFHVLGDPPLVKAVHFTFHVVSGVAYLWAVVLFPNGAVPLRRAPTGRRGWMLVVGLTAAVALVCWQSSFILHPPFFVAFFGVLVPLVGITAQSLQLRFSPDATSDKQSRLLRVALLPALAAALVWLVAEAAARVAGSPVPQQVAAAVQGAFPAVFAVVPVLMFVAIVRHRLWDIDVLATRTLMLGLLLVFVGIVYVACLGITGWLLQDTGFAVLVPLLVVAAIAEPVRARCQRLCNRLVFGTELSPREAVRSLVERFSGAGDVDELTELTRVVVHSTRAVSASIWLRRGDELLSLATHPVANAGGAPLHARVKLAAPTLGACRAALQPADCRPVSYEGELLGVVAVTTPRGVPLTSTESRLLADLSRHAGLLVANARLTMELARELEAVTSRAAQLERSREQVVQAQDLQRRRLESDIHDGAQQQLVALLVQLGVLQRSPTAVVARLLPSVRELLAATQQTLRTLAAGGAPPALVEYGLATALQEAADLLGGGGIAVHLSCDDVRWAGQEAETAVYFCCQEALQNIAKHARASSVWVHVTSEADAVTFSVVDDGIGFAPDSGGSGSGLGSLARRLTALGGRFEVVSGPGHGTAIRGHLPVAAVAAPQGEQLLASARSS
jgi:signal transduction histidine kinase